jgi:biopolymer transport protein ExbB
MHLLVLLTSFWLAMPSQAADWWQGEWKYRKHIALDTTAAGSPVSEATGRIPLLVRLHTGNFSFEGVAENGADLRFIAADGKTVLNHQIESFDPLLGMASIWVDLPQLEANSRQEIWLYYGNAAAPSVSNSQATFDANYLLLYHFNAALDAPARDSSAYGNHASNAVGTSVDSVIGRGLQLTGSQPLMLPASPSLAWAAGGEFSFSAWVRLDQAAGEQLLYARRDAAHALLIGFSQGVPFVAVDGQRSNPGQPLATATWQHVAVTAKGGQVQLYVNGKPAASLAAELPALTTAAAIGADVATTLPAGNSAVTPVTPFLGAIDELRLSKTARPAALMLVDAISQGSESRLVQYGVDEQQSSSQLASLSFLIKSVPFDAWFVLAILGFMMAQTWSIMISKSRHAKKLQAHNQAFRQAFSQVGTSLEMLADDSRVQERLQGSSLWRLYAVAVNELRLRRQQGTAAWVSTNTIEAIRVSMDAVRTREMQQLGSRMGLLSNAIAGAPYIGLFGTVLGIMVVFLATAMAGDVNINAIAPGMAAALLATAAGLFVAIPALFGYNSILGRNKEISADMRVFVDEFVARLAEVHGDPQAQPVFPPPHGARPQAQADAVSAV